MNKELVDYFIEQTNARFQSIETKLDQLFAFKWKIAGISLAVSTIVSLVVAVYFGR